jgi:glycosyltransferase involved in cell wall biosynthesis
MKILIVSPTPTHPTVAGNRARILSLAQGLSSLGHDVDFVWFPMEPGDEAAMKAFFGTRFHPMPYRAPSAKSGMGSRLVRRLRRLLGHEAAYVWKVDDWYDPAVSDSLRQLHAAHRFDVVFVEYVFVSRALEAFPADVVKVIDTHDRFGDRHLAYLRAGKTPEWFSTTLDEERRGLKRADVVVAIQEGEAAEFATLLGPGVQVATVGHLLDLSTQLPGTHDSRAVFVASSNSINAEAARYFVGEVLPLLRDADPQFELVLAGDVCSVVPDAPGIRKLGRVAKVSDAYTDGGVAINAVRMGTGLNIKTMECLALGVPLVTTESGSRGLETLRGKAFVSVPNDDPKAMADAVLAFVRDRALAARFGESARKAAREWNLLQMSTLESVLEGKAGAGLGPVGERSGQRRHTIE